ncbi:MAG: zinc-ribbon domain-containing protein [Gammaproteobacteria bacterium]|jgi:predicted Zn finger-like uncharacterized protein|nr:MAG: zinc-ribbon domain-containing protein [Gammaproteobacteria bacterium]
MALVTLCPGCGTTFRVNAAQLQAHGGDVRCGHCQRVFNGFATLITVNESALEYPLQPAVKTEAAVETYLPAPHEDNETPGWEQTDAESSAGLFDDEPARQSSSAWGWASLLLLLVLIGQVAFANRTKLTMIKPETRPHLEHYCALIGCQVPYPQDIRQLGIESSDLQKNPARQPEVTTMRATISNHALFPQALPALQLLLLDAQGQIIASRIFTAVEYLPEEDNTRQFIQPQQEIDVRLDFDSTNLGALGYRLQLLYP